MTQRESDLAGSGRPDLAEQAPEEEDGRPMGGASSLDSLESLVRVSKELSRRESDISVARQSDVGVRSAACVQGCASPGFAGSPKSRLSD